MELHVHFKATQVSPLVLSILSHQTMNATLISINWVLITITWLLMLSNTMNEIAVKRCHFPPSTCVTQNKNIQICKEPVFKKTKNIGS